MKKHLIYLLVTSIFFSCNETREQASTEEEAIPKTAVIITKNPKIKSKIEFKNGISMPGISYIELNVLPDSITWFEINNNEIDTFRINSQKSFIEVVHSYNTLHLLKYYLWPGDTLLIEYNDSVPLGHLINSKSLQFDSNYDAQLNEMLFSSQTTPGFKAAFPLPFMDRSRNLQVESDRVKNQATTEFTNGILREFVILDSLKEHNLISSENYYHRTINQFYNLLAFNLKYELGNEDLHYIMELKTQVIATGEAINYDEIVRESADSLMKYRSYIDFVEAYLNTKYSEVPIIRSKNSILKDYRIFFDSIYNDSKLSHAKKEYFLYKNMVKIVENFSLKDREKYLEKYEAFAPQPMLLENIKKDFGLDETTKDLELKDVNGNIITLEKLKSIHKGKLIYIDFWASWCKPCIELMPDSHHLRDSLADLEIEFLYFSIDEDEKKWKQASQKHKINVNNYLVSNRYSSVFLEEIGLDAIPRYLLYDKNGNLIQENASDPGASELRKTIFKYLNEPD